MQCYHEHVRSLRARRRAAWLQCSTGTSRSDSNVTPSASGPTCNSTTSGYLQKSTDSRCPRCSIGTGTSTPYTFVYLYVLHVGMKYPPGRAGTYIAGSCACQQHSPGGGLKKAVINCRHRKASAVIAAHKINPATNATQAGGRPRSLRTAVSSSPIEVLPTRP